LKSGVTRKPIDPAEVLESVRDDSAGGTVLFVGTIRSRSGKKEVKSLEYETYRRMVELRMKRLEREVRRRWPINAITVVHREGKLKVGDVSVVVGVSAEHRAEAFEAARYAIDYVKKSLPIWKRETLKDGGRVWVEGNPIQG
jgi:molybdopterin synthase catalytic subunit